MNQLLSESQEQLEAAKTETQKQSKELALVRRDPGTCSAGSLGLVCEAAVGPAPFLWAEGGKEGTAIAWANLLLLGTTCSEVTSETQKEIFICLNFPPVMEVERKGEQQGLLKLVCNRKTHLLHHWTFVITTPPWGRGLGVHPSIRPSISEQMR